MRFQNRVAVVTGAGGGIGESYAKLAREGARLVVAEIDAEQGERVAKEITAEGAESLFIKTDVSSEARLTRELGPRKIRVNAIAPGPVDTEATRRIVSEGILKGMLMGMPLSRVGATEDITGACLFLLSDEARWIAAQIVAVDGGFSMRA